MSETIYPSHVDIPVGSMWDALTASAARYPRQTALDYLGSRISFRALARRVEHAAAALSDMDVKQGDRVLLILPNIPQAVFLLYAINRLGAVAVMMHPDSAVDEIVRITRELDCRVVFLTARSAPACQSLLSEWRLHGRRSVLLDAMRFAPLRMRGRAVGPRVREVRLERESAFWSRGNGRLNVGAFDEDRPAVILFSGGTFGEPKAVVLTNRAMNAAAAQTVAVSGQTDVSGSSILALMPVFHGFGLCVGVHTPLAFGATSVLLPKYTPALCAATLRRLPLAYLPGVPTFFLKWARAVEMADVDLSHLRGVFCGGDRLSPEAKAEIDTFLATHGATVCVRQGYGLTESASVVTLSPEGAGADDTIGLPLPNTCVRLVDPETLSDVGVGEIGEIWIAGPTVMRGYLGDDVLNAKTLVNESGTVWLRTGDLARRDEAGFLHFEQRIKRLIVTSGYNVYPSAVETALRETGLVEDAAVIGLADDLRGQSVVAFVVPGTVLTADPDNADAILSAALATWLPRYAIPHRFLFVEQLPLTVVGKIAYGRLEEAARIDKSRQEW